MKPAIFSKLQKLLNLREGEGSTVSLLLVFSFFQYFSLALLFVAASAIFLTDNSIRELPFVFIGTSISLIILAIVFNQLEKVFSMRSIMITEAVMICVIIVVFRFGFNYELSWIGYGLIIGHRVIADYIEDGFNRLVLMLLNVRQSKRLYGLVTSAEIPANVLGYLAATLLIPFMGTIDLLWISAGGLLLSVLVLVWIVTGKHGKTISTFDYKNRAEIRQISVREKSNLFRKIFKTRFIFLLSITVVASVISIIFIEFAFLYKVDAETTNQKDIVLLISIVFGIGQFIAFFIKTFLYNIIQRNFGIRFNLMVLPVILAGISLLIIVESFFNYSSSLLIYSWILIMLITEILNSSLYKTTFISLLQPLESKMKMMGYKVLNNVEILAIGIGGLILVLTYSEDINHLLYYSYLLLGGVALWMVCIPYLNKQYLATLEQVLSKRFIETSALDINTPQTIRIIKEKLKSRHPGEVIYALDVLTKGESDNRTRLLMDLITHPAPEVRKEVLVRIKSFKVIDLFDLVRVRIKNDEDSTIKKLAIETYCLLGETNVTDEIGPLIYDEDHLVQVGALVGLINYGGIDGIVLGGQRLLEFINSKNAKERAFAAYIIGEVGIHNFYRPILTLLNDKNLKVQRSAIQAAGKIKHPKLFESMVNHVANSNLFEPAMNALIQCGDHVLDTFNPILNQEKTNSKLLRRLFAITGKINSPKSIELLKDKLYYPDIEVRDQILQACIQLHYASSTSESTYVLQTIHAEIADATWLLKFINLLQETRKESEKSNFNLLIQALHIELKHINKRLLYLLSILYGSKEISQVWERLQMKDKTKIANALEIVDVLVAKELALIIMPLLENYPIVQQLKLLNNKYPIPDYSLDQFLTLLLNDEDSPQVLPWTRAVAIYTVQELLTPALRAKLNEINRGEESLFKETASYTLAKIEQIGNANRNDNKKMETKLLTIEKVMALKTTAIFKETPEDLLVDIASILHELPFLENSEIVKKSEIGNCMYIIYSGSVLVHDGEVKLAELKEGNFFGELALLDSEPRSASVTALEDSLLLMIDQEAFYEIMADRSEVIREIMKILCERLRNQNIQVSKLREELKLAHD